MRKIEFKILKGILAKVVSFIVNVSRAIVLVPIFLSYWGEDKYGVWIAIFSFFNLMLAIDLGHGQYIGNEINKRYHVSTDDVMDILGSALRVTFLSTLIQTIILYGLYIGGVFNKIFDTSIISQQDTLLCLSLLFMYRLMIGGFKGIVVKLNFPTGYIDRAFYMSVFEQIVELIVLSYVIINDLSIVSLCILFVSAKMLYTFLQLYLHTIWYPKFFPWWKVGSLRTGIINYRRSITLSINSFLERFSNDGLNLLVAGIIGNSALPLFSTTKTLSNIAFQLSGFILQPFQPELSRFYVKNEFRKIVNAIRLNWFFTGVVICIPFLVATPFVEKFYIYWTAGKLDFYADLYALFIFGILIFNYGNSYLTYLSSINDIRSLFKITILRGLGIVLMAAIFLHYFGLVGVGIAILMSEVLTSLVLPSYYVNSKFKLENAAISKLNKYFSIAPVIITGGYHILRFVCGFDQLSLLSFAIVLVLYALWRQWSMIDGEVRSRIINLIPGLKTSNLHL